MSDPRPIAATLFDMIDGAPCDWDHNHSCQEHGFWYLDQGAMCPQEEAKRWLLANGSDVPGVLEWLRGIGYE